MRLNRPLPSWNGWISRRTTVKIAVTRRGCNCRDENASEVQVTSSDIRRGVSNGVAVSNTIPTCSSSLVERCNIVRLGLVIAAMMRVLFAVFEQIAMHCLMWFSVSVISPQDWKISSMVSA